MSVSKCQNGAAIRLLRKNNLSAGLNRSSHAINPSPRDKPKPRRSAAIKGSRKIGNSPSTHRNVGIMGSHSDSPKTRRKVSIRGIANANNISNNLMRVHKTRSGVCIRKSKANLLDLSFLVTPQGTPLWGFPVFTP